MKKNKKIISLLVTVVTALFVFINSNNSYENYKVVKVVDGDTIVVEHKGKEERVRLIGVDTPESVHPDASKNTEEGKTASKFTKSKLEGKEVELEFDVQERDKYGRLLAYVWINGEMYNKVLLKEGYAKVATFPPNVKYVDEFTSLEKEARENKKGLWGELIEDKEILEEKTTGKYKASKNSDKYHLADFTHSGEISPNNVIWFDSIEEAEEKGYKPCGICFKK